MPLTKLFSREYSVQYTEASLRSLGKEVQSHLPALLLTQCYIPEEKNQACYADPAEWKNLHAALNKEYSTPKKLKNLIANFHKYGKEYVATSKSISKKPLSKLKNTELLKLYREYLKILNLYSAYLWTGFLLNNIYSEKGKQLLDKKNLHDDKILKSLFSPSKKSGILLLQDNLAKLKLKHKTLSEKTIAKLLKEYTWMSCLDIQNHLWTETELIDFYTHLAPTSNATKQTSFADAARSANLNPKEQLLFRQIQELTYVKDMRDVYRRQAVFYAYKLYDEIAARCSVKRRDLAHLTNAEMISAISACAVDQKQINQRKIGFLIYWKNNVITVESDLEKINEFRKAHLEITQEKSEITGMVASRGHATGRVKIVYGIKDLSEVQKGDILIAITTHPDFVPAMHKAAAIITNEGGLTSHAAIVSRELDVPCIVDTKIATKFFKDNDLVEVDAEKGIIRKIK